MRFRLFVIGLLSLVFSGCEPALCPAQTVEHMAVASQFNAWRAFASQALAVGANANVAVIPCTVVGDGAHSSIPVLAANQPLKIVDPNNSAIDELVTPTSIVGCTATFTVANAHPQGGFYFVSGTGGLQEALNNSAQSGALNVVELDSLWHMNGGSAATIYAAAGSPYLGLSDISVSPPISYKWNGTHYVPTYSINGTSVSFTAGAAAGTSPTLTPSPASTGNSWTLTLVEGSSPPTSGTLATVTVTASSGTLNCTGGAALGSAQLTGLTVTGTSSTVGTIAVTGQPTAGATYIISGTCE